MISGAYEVLKVAKEHTFIDDNKTNTKLQHFVIHKDKIAMK